VGSIGGGARGLTGPRWDRAAARSQWRRGRSGAVGRPAPRSGGGGRGGAVVARRGGVRRGGVRGGGGGGEGGEVVPVRVESDGGVRTTITFHIF
jgi:hypothetical protein